MKLIGAKLEYTISIFSRILKMLIVSSFNTTTFYYNEVCKPNFLILSFAGFGRFPANFLG